MSSPSTCRRELLPEIELHDAMGGNYVRVINDASLAVQGKVLRTEKRICVGNAAKRIEFEENTRRAHFDFLPIIRFHRDAYFKNQRDALRKKGCL